MLDVYRVLWSDTASNSGGVLRHGPCCSGPRRLQEKRPRSRQEAKLSGRTRGPYPYIGVFIKQFKLPPSWGGVRPPRPPIPGRPPASGIWEFPILQRPEADQEWGVWGRWTPHGEFKLFKKHPEVGVRALRHLKTTTEGTIGAIRVARRGCVLPNCTKAFDVELISNCSLWAAI